MGSLHQVVTHTLSPTKSLDSLLSMFSPFVSVESLHFIYILFSLLATHHVVICISE